MNKFSLPHALPTATAEGREAKQTNKQTVLGKCSLSYLLPYRKEEKLIKGTKPPAVNINKKKKKERET